MKTVVYTEHLKLRLKLRKIPESYPKIIYESPEEKYYDRAENRQVAIKKLHYNQKIRLMMIAYEEATEKVEIVTIHPMTESKIKNRASRGRWIKRG